MQTLRLIIPGSYYDSQIYSGRLYLWSNDGSIITFDWDQLIESISVPDHLRLAITCAFQISEYLYGDHWKLIFQDTEIRKTLQRKFQELAEKSPIEFSSEELRKHYIREQDNPFSFPHADCTIYSNTLYVGSRNGILTAKCGRKTKVPIGTKPERIWDGPALSLSASYQTLAISAGNEGLFEYGLEADYIEQRHHEPRSLIKHHSNFARWLYASMFSSSYFDEGYLADFVNQEDKDDRDIKRRVLREIVPSNKIFGHQTKNGASSLTWGLHDKICFATPEFVEVVQYAPYKEEDERFTRLGIVQTERPIGDIISGDSALFGFIVESEDGLLIINSLMESIWLQGEPVNWRVFPKSKFYTNQLHVIYEDHLCIHSFNHDYFVDQKTKIVGTRHPREYYFPRSSR